MNMRENRRRVTAHLTIYRMLVVAIIGLVVGTLSSFATIGFVETVHWLNRVFYITAESRVDLPSNTLMMITVLTPTLGGLVVGLILRYGVNTGKSLGPP